MMDRKITLVGILSMSLVGAAILATQVLNVPSKLRGTSYGEPFPAAPNFNLVNQDGESVFLEKYSGKIILLFFGYTYCPDVCPTTLSELRLVLELVGERAERVQVIFISVDPGRDTILHVQEYVERFDPSFIGLSGPESELKPIWNGYGVIRDIVPGTSESNYIVNHTARVFLVDQQGRLRLSYGFQTPPEDIAHDIKVLLEG